MAAMISNIYLVWKYALTDTYGEKKNPFGSNVTKSITAEKEVNNQVISIGHFD